MEFGVASEEFGRVFLVNGRMIQIWSGVHILLLAPGNLLEEALLTTHVGWGDSLAGGERQGCLPAQGSGSHPAEHSSSSDLVMSSWHQAEGRGIQPPWGPPPPCSQALQGARALSSLDLAPPPFP